jgi:hypothetical protein
MDFSLWSSLGLLLLLKKFVIFHFRTTFFSNLQHHNVSKSIIVLLNYPHFCTQDPGRLSSFLCQVKLNPKALADGSIDVPLKQLNNPVNLINPLSAMNPQYVRQIIVQTEVYPSSDYSTSLQSSTAIPRRDSWLAGTIRRAISYPGELFKFWTGGEDSVTAEPTGK